jgi:hypothetical protein
MTDVATLTIRNVPTRVVRGLKALARRRNTRFCISGEPRGT